MNMNKMKIILIKLNVYLRERSGAFPPSGRGGGGREVSPFSRSAKSSDVIFFPAAKLTVENKVVIAL